MIEITRLDDTRMIVNSSLIEIIEAKPDTTITMTSGRVLIVKEPVEKVVDLVVAYRHRIQKFTGGE